ncbi:ABC transporter ATP-binding protein [Xylophilus sp. GW821-FHT01B05]
MSCEPAVAIRAQDLGKCYHIYDAPAMRLRQFILPRLRKLMGQAEHRYYRSFWALRGLGFEIRRGETVGIIGRNGSGKSTLLQMICGTLAPSAGEVETFGRIAALLELGSGFNPDYSGRENVYMNCTVLGLSKEQIDQRFDSIVGFADIGDFIDQPVKTYSSGMFARLAFAAAIHVDPEILIVDEALAVGDFAFQFKCLRRLKELAAGGCTVLFVTHDIEQVQRLCSRALYLRNGEAVFYGDAGEACSRYLADVRETEAAIVGQPLLEGGVSPVGSASSDEQIHQEFAERVAGHRSGSRQQGEILALSVNGVHGAEPYVGFAEQLVVEITFRVNEPVPNPTVAFYVVDAAGQLLVGTNTHNEGVDLRGCKIGDICKLRISLENRLRPGRFGLQTFLVDYQPAVNTEYIDHIDLAGSFVSGQEPGVQRWALVSPRFSVDLYR